MASSTFDLRTPAEAGPAANPLGLLRLDHVRYCGDLEALEGLHRRLGFARQGSEQGAWGRSVHLRQNRMDVVVTDADGSRPAGRYFQAHGPGVHALAFEVADVPFALNEAARRGAEVLQAEQRVESPEGAVIQGAIQGFGDVWNIFIHREGEAPFLPDFRPDPRPSLCRPGLLRVDHLTNNVGVGEMDRWVDFYQRVYGFGVVREFHIRGVLGTGLSSKVVQSENGRVIIPINEPSDAKSQVQEFVERHRGPGVQHLAMSTAGIMETLPQLRAQGFRFLENPSTYYEMLPERIRTGGYSVGEDLARLREMGILVDGDPTGYLLQIFTEDQVGPLFYEIIQRKGNRGFGEGNFKALYDSIELDQQRRGVL
ncbi:MAG: 4-hydroxyphenylpyruvate dioxygenase [Acidobacteria bacterium]|nr:4-hydroxyphenylpyruvate dioxygenase [Acidobacteriota bacterium]